MDEGLYRGAVREQKISADVSATSITTRCLAGGKSPPLSLHGHQATNWVCQESFQGGRARPEPSRCESLLWAGGSEPPAEADATESFHRKKRNVRHSNAVLHSRSRGARTQGGRSLGTALILLHGVAMTSYDYTLLLLY